MKVLIACELSGIVRDAFRFRGHEAYSIDIEKDINPSSRFHAYHYRGDVLRFLDGKTNWERIDWDMLIAFPPCTALSVSGAKHFKYKKVEQFNGLYLVKRLMEMNVSKIAVENPVSVISTFIRKPDQIIQPYNFGEDVSKRTCLWLKDLPKLVGTKFIPPRIVDYKGKMVERWGNQSPCGADSRGPSTTRGLDRSITHLGIAKAMANQWG